MATAIPKISDHFNTLNDVGWYASAFLLTTYGTSGVGSLIYRAALQPTFGKLYKVFNVKWVFLIAVAVFESISMPFSLHSLLVGSLICALSPNSVTLIVGRAIAGSGGAVISPHFNTDNRESCVVRLR